MRSIVFLIAVVVFREDFIDRGCALQRGQHMIELWIKWFESLASVEGLAAIVVVAVMIAGVLTLIEGRRSRTKKH
ncbi:hypothetical protein IVA87_30570 [Bradyrhizobium sp. 147]|uniref:hypothetical protein n=1 Tax=unclassified Bradyrhizobium TaxID=2631580 RepID=UPI001FFC1039|nr:MULTISPECIES: hypothetical protein [unclassified Bradyrhizobium]MCK1544465.1 hypothetical protein [Bradyrhizobium sp. 179]MCK1626837.1 hypothetical protein [Bradyrhizobium sp. 160]MCK1683620.1 hypothetical protein [Bradyrhizobium sp. 147]